MGQGGEGASSGGGETQFAMPTMGGAESASAGCCTSSTAPDTEELEPPKPKSKMPLVAALVLLIGGGGEYAAYEYKLEQDRLAAEKLAADQAEVTRLTDACNKESFSECETLSRAYIQGELSLTPSPSKPNELCTASAKTVSVKMPVISSASSVLSLRQLKCAVRWRHTERLNDKAQAKAEAARKKAEAEAAAKAESRA